MRYAVASSPDPIVEAMPSARKRFVVKLSAEEREALEDLVRKGKVKAQKRRHAALLLLVDEGEYGPALTDAEVAEQFGAGHRTVARVRERCVTLGLEVALERQPRTRDRAPRLDGAGEAQLVTLACSEPPAGQARWTMQLLADKLVELSVLESISDETVRRVLKKHHQTLAAHDVVHPADAKRGVRVPDGGRAGRVSA